MLIRILIVVSALLSGPLYSADSHLNQQLTIDDAIHLLSRTGLGAHAAEVSMLIGKSRNDAVDDVLLGLSADANQRMPEWIDDAPPYMLRGGMEPAERRRFSQERNREFNELRKWWVSEMLTTTSPQTERLVLFWHNHFVSSYKGLGNWSTGIARQNRFFREHASGSFRSLLHGIVKDPVMLRYLDNNNNRKKAPNENLARELFELFTLGEGNYTEFDIKEAARALTGHTFAVPHNLTFRLIPGQHDAGMKTIFGSDGKFDGQSLVDLILDQDRTAEFIAGKFWQHYINENEIDDLQIKQWADIFRRSDYDISLLLETLLRSKEFWAKEHRHTIVKSPVDLVIGSARTLGNSVQSVEKLLNAISEQGQDLFNPPNVAGWPGGNAWVTPGRLLKRLQWLRKSARMDKVGSDSAPAMDSDNMLSTDKIVQKLESNLRVSSKTLNNDAQVIAVDNVFISKLDNPEIKTKFANRNDEGKSSSRSLIMFQLENLQYQNRQWRNWMFRLILESDGSAALSINRYDCWPDCLEVWSECSQRVRGDEYARQVVLGLRSTENKPGKTRRCQLRDLAQEDQSLVEAIIGNLVNLHSFAGNDVRLKNPVKKKAYDAWQPVLAMLQSNHRTPVDLIRTDSKPASLKRELLVTQDMQGMRDEEGMLDKAVDRREQTDNSAAGSVAKLSAILNDKHGRANPKPSIVLSVQQWLDHGGLSTDNFKRDLSATAIVHFAIEGRRSLRHPIYQLR